MEDTPDPEWWEKAAGGRIDLPESPLSTVPPTDPRARTVEPRRSRRGLLLICIASSVIFCVGVWALAMELSGSNESSSADRASADAGDSLTTSPGGELEDWSVVADPAGEFTVQLPSDASFEDLPAEVIGSFTEDGRGAEAFSASGGQFIVSAATFADAFPVAASPDAALAGAAAGIAGGQGVSPEAQSFLTVDGRPALDFEFVREGAIGLCRLVLDGQSIYSMVTGSRADSPTLRAEHERFVNSFRFAEP